MTTTALKKNHDVLKNVETAIKVFMKKSKKITIGETMALSRLGLQLSEQPIPSEAYKMITGCRPLINEIGYNILLNKHVNEIDYAQFISLVDFKQDKPSHLFQKLCVMEHTRANNTNMELTFDKAHEHATGVDFTNMLKTLITSEEYKMDKDLFTYIFKNEQHPGDRSYKIFRSPNPHYQSVISLIKKHPDYSQY